MALTIAMPSQALPAGTSNRVALVAIWSGQPEAPATRQCTQMNEQAASVTDPQRKFDLLPDTIPPPPRRLPGGVEANLSRRWPVRCWVEVAYLLADMDYSIDDRAAARVER